MFGRPVVWILVVAFAGCIAPDPTVEGLAPAGADAETISLSEDGETSPGAGRNGTIWTPPVDPTDARDWFSVEAPGVVTDVVLELTWEAVPGGSERLQLIFAAETPIDTPVWKKMSTSIETVEGPSPLTLRLEGVDLRETTYAVRVFWASDGPVMGGAGQPFHVEGAIVHDPTPGVQLPAAPRAAEGIRPLMAGVPCEAEVAEDATSGNLKVLAEVQPGYGTHGEIDIRDGWLLSARYGEGGFDVVDVRDPTAPVWTVSYQDETASGALDVKWMPDGETAVVGHGRAVDLVDVSPVTRSGLAPEEIEAEGTAPRLVSRWEYPDPPLGHTSSNMHMLATARIADVDWVFVAPNDDTGVALLKLEGSGADRRLTLVRHIGDDLMSGGPIGPHDMSVVMDEMLQGPVLYVANGFEGWRAFDVSDPAQPVPLAAVPNFGLAQGYTHTVVGQEVDGRRLVATVQEVGVNMLTVWDATDFARPVPLAQWQADRTNPVTPQHNIQIVHGRLYVAHYTHGAYVFDLAGLDDAPPGLAELDPVAHFVPAAPDLMGFGNVWDVVVHHGVLYVNDREAGVSVLGFGCIVPGDPGETSEN